MVTDVSGCPHRYGDTAKNPTEWLEGAAAPQGIAGAQRDHLQLCSVGTGRWKRWVILVRMNGEREMLASRYNPWSVVTSSRVAAGATCRSRA